MVCREGTKRCGRFQNTQIVLEDRAAHRVLSKLLPVPTRSSPWHTLQQRAQLTTVRFQVGQTVSSAVAELFLPLFYLVPCFI